MYDDGTGVEHDYCITCYVKESVILDPAMYMVMGNEETQHINSYGYCMEHAENIIRAFNKSELMLTHFTDRQKKTEHVDAALVKWIGGGNAYFL